MTKVVFNRTIPMIDRDSFLTPFDKLFDQLVSAQFPEMAKNIGVNPMSNTAYPKVNVYEYDDKVGVVAEIPGLDKADLQIDVEDGVLTVAGNKHGLFDDEGAKVIRRELKHSSFKRQFELGEQLDGKKIKASFKDGLLSIEIPKIEPAKPKKHSVKIS